MGLEDKTNGKENPPDERRVIKVETCMFKEPGNEDF